MNLKKIAALILTAALLLCSCGNAETEESGGGRITRNTETAEAVDTEKNDAEELDETAEENEKTAEPAEDVTYETAVENAEIVFDKIAVHTAKLTARGEKTTEAYLYFSSMNEDLLDVAAVGDEYFEIMPEFNEDIGGVYLSFNSSEGYPELVIWASSLESKVFGTYPEDDFYGLRYAFEEGMKENSLGDCLRNALLRYVEDCAMQDANAKAELVYNSALTYLAKAQISGAKFDSTYIKGTIGEKSDILPINFEFQEVLTDEDVTNALCYYMGGPDGGVYAISVTKDCRIIGALWAADEKSRIIGGHPADQSISYDIIESIYTIGIDRAIFGNLP
jgi:hypothetical protein